MARLDYCPDCNLRLVTYTLDYYTVTRCPRYDPDVQSGHYYSVYDFREGYGGLGDHGKPHDKQFDTP